MKSVRILDTRDKRELQNDIDNLLTMKANRKELPTMPSQVGADYDGAAIVEMNKHNSSASAHSDIRDEIDKINNKVNTISESVGRDGYTTIGSYSFIPNTDGHLTLVYTG